ncbi:MAG: hypothetical protein HYR96_09335 [Deltaproteobacteria bacterium]|nr:hypothetical protein [Deltaproteobacteria bacterium]MBI3293587.1 hypothetical protein [Deltaproteobacteria bacterium]
MLKDFKMILVIAVELCGSSQASLLGEAYKRCQRNFSVFAKTSRDPETGARYTKSFGGLLSISTVERSGKWARGRFHVATLNYPLVVFRRDTIRDLPNRLEVLPLNTVTATDVDRHLTHQSRIGLATFYSEPDSARTKKVGMESTQQGRYLHKLELPPGTRILIIDESFSPSVANDLRENEIVIDSLLGIKQLGIEDLGDPK